MVSNHSSTDRQLAKSGILLFIKGLFSLKWEREEWERAGEMYLEMRKAQAENQYKLKW